MDVFGQLSSAGDICVAIAQHMHPPTYQHSYVKHTKYGGARSLLCGRGVIFVLVERGGPYSGS